MGETDFSTKWQITVWPDQKGFCEKNIGTNRSPLPGTSYFEAIKVPVLHFG